MGSTIDKLKKKRIFIGTTEIAGYYKNLSKGLDKLDISYKYVQLSPNSSGFGTETSLPFLIKLPYILAKYRLRLSVEPGLYTVHKTKKGMLSLSRFIFYFLECLLRIFIVLPWAILNFDIFCFGARSNIVGIKTGYWDIVLLKWLKKKIIFVYHGSDSRPPYINGSILHDLLKNNSQWPKTLNQITKKIKRTIVKLDQLADIIIVNPYSAHFHQKSFINWFAIGSPYIDPEEECIAKELPEKTNKTINILHAPTHRIAKGSPLIEDCIRALQQEGYSIKLSLIHGRPHHEVIHAIKTCDFVIDELYSDALMAGFAAEASYYAKPVIVCGYIEDKYLTQRIPTYYCRPEDLKSAITTFLNQPELRKNLGRKAQKFVMSEWSYLKIAECYKKIFEGNIPAEWLVAPNSISYVQGFGMDEQLLKKCITSFIQKFGASALQLDDKPALLRNFLDFADIQS